MSRPRKMFALLDGPGGRTQLVTVELVTRTLVTAAGERLSVHYPERTQPCQVLIYHDRLFVLQPSGEFVETDADRVDRAPSMDLVYTDQELDAYNAIVRERMGDRVSAI